MAAARFVSPLFFWPDASGAPLPNATLQFFAGDSDTPASVYLDAELTQPVTVVRSNGAGVWPAIFLAAGVIYKAVLSDQYTAQVWSQYPITASGVFYPVAWDFLGGTPALANEVMMMHTFDFAVTFPPNFSGSGGYVLVNPAATFDATIGNQNGVAIGTMTITTGGAFSFTTTNGLSVTAQALDTWILKAPAIPDTNAANFSGTFLGVAA